MKTRTQKVYQTPGIKLRDLRMEERILLSNSGCGISGFKDCEEIPDDDWIK